MYRKESKYLHYDTPYKVNIKYVIRWIITFIANLYWKIVFFFLKPERKASNKYIVSLCAIFRDEADYLKEWIEFHRLVGVDHFYLYNNFSEDSFEDILGEYIENGVVTLIDWPYPQSQMKAYKHCVDNYGQETNWIGFIDLDEFVIPNKHNSIREFLEKFEYRPIVLMYWRCFGTSGILERNKKNLIIEDFTIACEKYTNIGKVFYNTKYEYLEVDKKNVSMHYMWAKYKGIKLPPVNAYDKTTVFYGYEIIPNKEMPIQINHYMLKSYSEYVEKKAKRGGGVHGVGMHNMDYFFDHERLCNKPDFHAYKYLMLLKLRLKNQSREQQE